MNKGLSLLEILVVMGIFAILGVLATGVITLSLQGSRKGGSMVKVRENVNYAVAIMERQLRNAETITDCTTTGTTSLSYTDATGIPTFFECKDLATNGYVASGSARLTNNDVKVTSCSFSCPGSVSIPPQVEINITATDPNAATAKESATVSITTMIDLRTY